MGNFRFKQRQGFVEPLMLAEHSGRDGNASRLNDCVVVRRGVSRVMLPYMRSHNPCTDDQAPSQPIGGLIANSLEKRSRHKPVYEPDGLLHRASPLGTPHEGVLFVPIFEQVGKLGKITIHARNEIGLRQEGKLTVPVQLPVGADVTRHALVAEGVVRRKAHRPVAERLERGVPALSIFGILIAAQKFYVRPNAELVVREIDAKSREIRL